MPYTTVSKLNTQIKSPILAVSQDESPALYSSHAIKTFAQSLMGLFIPIYIFTLEYIPEFTGKRVIDGFLLILIFYLIRSISAIWMMNFVTNTIFGFLNFKKSIFVANICLALGLTLLALTPHSIVFLFISAVLFAAETNLYWIPYHLFFIRKASNGSGKYGRSFGIRILSSQLASAIGPLIGGFIIAFFGFIVLFTIGTVLIVVSAIPILFSVHEHNHGKHNASHIFSRLIRSKSLINDTIAISSTEADALMYAVFWPVLLFIIAESYTTLGIITSISVTISCLAALLIGNLVDTKGARFIHKIGCVINSILYLPRAFLTSLQAFFILDVVDKLNGILYAVPFNAVMYEHAKARMHESDYIIYRAVVCHVAIAITCVVAIALVVILPEWRYIFIFMAMVAPFAYLINKKP